MQEEKPPRREREKLRQREEMLAVASISSRRRDITTSPCTKLLKKPNLPSEQLYKFFRSKEDLYKALIMEMAAEYHNALSAVLSRQGDVLTILNDYITVKMGIFDGNLGHFTALFC